jgi:hypothetical protein
MQRCWGTATHQDIDPMIAGRALPEGFAQVGKDSSRGWSGCSEEFALLHLELLLREQSLVAKISQLQ